MKMNISDLRAATIQSARISVFMMNINLYTNKFNKMLINEKILKTLEFDKVREMLAERALTEGARELARTLTPTDDRDEVLRRLRRTTDAIALMNLKGTPPFGDVKNMTDVCDRADKGAVLTPRELLDAANVLRTARALLDYIRVNRTIDTSLDEIFERLMTNRKAEDQIFRSVISEELIADDASPALAEIRRKKRAAGNRIKEILQKYITTSSYAKYLQENIVTTRNGRYVIPVKAEYKSEIKGLVHDTSASGATLFVEPMAVVDANNELRVLESNEEKEIERILFALSALVSENSNAIRFDYQNIVEISFVFACGELSNQMNGVPAVITDEKERSVVLHGARHPLIDKNKVVPTNIELGEGFDTMIITGPNTGGKTVTLKTLGLFSLMTQAGLHIPAKDGSRVCLFSEILADIGDEQSIEQSLSTFSSHMVNIVAIMKQVSDRSLVLFDELGVGTDPVEGAALAVAVIEAVRAKGAMCAATTHYAELKMYALDTEGVRNASCEFDVETLKPTYKLILGAPGRSNAFAISKKLGLPDEIVQRAAGLVGSESRRFEDVIEKLDAERLKMEHDREETARMREEYERFKAEAERRIQEKMQTADQTLEAARGKANAMVESAKMSSDFVLAQLDAVRKQRESERLGEALDQARRDIRRHLRENEDRYNPVEEKKDENYVLPRPLRKGDAVYIVNIGKSGVLTEDPDRSGNVTVRAGILSTRTKVSNLKLIEDGEVLLGENKKPKKVSDYKLNLDRSFRAEIDLRGMTGEEAWLAVDKYLDDAVVAGIKTVHLIHGKGTGALKNALWKFLKGDKRLASFRIGRYGEGDGGVTVVELK